MGSERHLVTLNGNILAAIDTETTGLIPEYHDLVEVAVIPLDAEYNPIQDILPFHAIMRPKFPARADDGAMGKNRRSLVKLMLEGMDPWTAVDQFLEWFDRLNLKPGKMIAPLAHNWAFDSRFLRAWLGPLTYEATFHGHVRDSMQVALFLNDLADLHVLQWPFPKMALGSIADRFHIVDDGMAHTALQDAAMAAKIYKRMLYEAGRICTHMPSRLGEIGETEKMVRKHKSDAKAEAKAEAVADAKAEAEAEAEAEAAAARQAEMNRAAIKS